MLSWAWQSHSIVCSCDLSGSITIFSRVMLPKHQMVSSKRCTERSFPSGRVDKKTVLEVEQA